MLIERLFDPIDPNKERTRDNLKLTGVSVKHTGVSRAQNFSSKLVSTAVADGWMSLVKGQIVLHAREGDLTYKVLRSTGHYCCHCGERLPNESDARAHVAANHAGEKSPDKNNPSGYKLIDGYETELDEETHNRFRVEKPFDFITKSAKRSAVNG